MRYYQRGETLVIRGSFRAVSSAPGGGLGQAGTLLMYSAAPGEESGDPRRLIGNEIAREGLQKEFFGLVTPPGSRYTCILRFDFITAFITARRDPRLPTDPVTIHIVVCSSEGFSDDTLVGAVVTLTESKVLALREAGYPAPGPGDSAIVASEGEPVHASAGIASEAGKRIRDAVIFGIPEAVRRASAPAGDSPAFFIFSRFKGSHWVEWQPDQCPYYPCHFKDQACDFCYCPFYPCGDESLGQWVESSSKNSAVWNCAQCTLLHEPEVAAYLKEHPMASLRELRSRKKKLPAKNR